MSHFAVVICAHDDRRWDDLREAVRSVERQSLHPRELVVVVDRNSTLFERAGRELAGVRVVENTDHPGLGGARNSGVRASTAPLVAFLDDDAVASEHWLQLFAAEYEDPNVAGVGGSIEPVWDGGRPSWFPPEFDWVVGCSYRGMPETTQRVRNLIGCNMSYRRDVLSMLGLFRLGYGCDETELCIRLGQRWPEKHLVYNPEAKVFHRVRAQRATFRRFLGRCYFEGGSKAVVSQLVGRDHGLASERRYVRKVLPRAVVKRLADAARLDPSGAACVAAVVAGLASTTAGYILANMAVEKSARVRGWAEPTFP